MPLGKCDSSNRNSAVSGGLCTSRGSQVGQPRVPELDVRRGSQKWPPQRLLETNNPPLPILWREESILSGQGDHLVWSAVVSHLQTNNLEFCSYTRFPWWFSGKESACNARIAGDVGSIPGLERSPEGGHRNPFLYSCLENPMDRGAWWATAHRVAESDMTEVT